MRKSNTGPSYAGKILDFNRQLLDELENTGYNYYVYILQCRNGEYYTGVTNNLEARLFEHEKGVNEKCFTRDKRPVELKYFELYHDIEVAINREKQIKGWSRKKKESLFDEDWERLKRLSRKRRRN